MPVLRISICLGQVPGMADQFFRRRFRLVVFHLVFVGADSVWGAEYVHPRLAGVVMCQVRWARFGRRRLAARFRLVPEFARRSVVCHFLLGAALDVRVELARVPPAEEAVAVFSACFLLRIHGFSHRSIPIIRQQKTEIIFTLA